MSREKIGFETLQARVINTGRCCSCGACVASCPIDVVGMQQLRPTLVGNCTKCGFCLKSCPRMIEDYGPVSAQVYGAKAKRDPVLGVYRKAYSLRNADETVRVRAQDGGVVTALLVHLLETKRIQGAVVSSVDSETPWRPIPKVATTRDELVAATKSRYTRSSNLVALREALKKRKLERIAVVGTPCHIQAIQRMRLAPLKKVDQAVVMTIGLFCSETFSFDQLMVKKIAGDLGVPLDKLRKVDIKGKLLVYPREQTEALEIPLKEARTWTEPGCNYCTDFTSEFADISVGGSGSPRKYSTVLARSERGEALIEEMLAAGKFLRGELKPEALDSLRNIGRPKVTRQPGKPLDASPNEETKPRPPKNTASDSAGTAIAHNAKLTTESGTGLSAVPFVLGVLKLGNIGTSPLLELLLDERAEREDLDVVLVGSGAKMTEAAAERSAILLVAQKPQLVLIPSPNAALKGPAKARETVKAAGIPVIVLSDTLPKAKREELAAEGYGYIMVPADSMIGARREFLDPTEMALFNTDVIRVLAATGALRRVQRALDEVIATIAARKAPKLPGLVINAEEAVAEGNFTNPYARVKAMAAYEMAVSVAALDVKGCFEQKEFEQYVRTVAAAHELMRVAARLADEARETEKQGDTVYRTPHFDEGVVGRKTKLMEKPKRD
jgi:methylenetetrahydromethanopterin dehydrogenase